MKGTHCTSNNATDVMLNPHPPNVPVNNKNEILLRLRQRQYAPQFSEPKNEISNFDNREIKSAGSNTDASYLNQKQERFSYKSKICSAPSPRSRISSDYRSNIIQREESSGLYTFNSIPSLIPDTNDNTNMRRITKRKENNMTPHLNIWNIKEKSLEPNLPSLVFYKSLKPCKSEASPVTSIPFSLRISRRSLQQLSKEKLTQISRKSMQNFLSHSKLEIPLDAAIKNSQEIQNIEPINLTQYRLANDLSDSFESRVLASLVAQNSHEVNVNIPTILPQILNSKDFTRIPSRTDALLICGSYSDEESSVITTGPITNKANLNASSERHGMHNEFKSRINCSEDTARSIDVLNSITDSSTLVDDGNGNNTTHKSSRYQDYLLVHYIPDFDCFYDPETGIFYESAF